MRLPNRSVFDLLLGSKFQSLWLSFAAVLGQQIVKYFLLTVLMVKCPFEVPLQVLYFPNVSTCNILKTNNTTS
jgi:hypothetical protein